jgi:hypothetical protein
MNIKQAQHHLPSTCDGLIGGRGKVFLEKTRDFQNWGGFRRRKSLIPI